MLNCIALIAALLLSSVNAYPYGYNNYYGYNRFSTGGIIGVVVGGVFLLILLTLLMCCMRRRRRRNNAGMMGAPVAAPMQQQSYAPHQTEHQSQTQYPPQTYQEPNNQYGGGQEYGQTYAPPAEAPPGNYNQPSYAPPKY